MRRRNRPESPGSSTQVTRRRFLSRSGQAAGGALLALGPAWRGVFAAGADTPRKPGPNDRLNIAIIGVGGRGGANLAGVSSENIVALCDVHEPPVLHAAQKHPHAKRYRDLRRVFDNARDFDAVVVSTCEHTHAFAVLPALQLRKHVYCEKPLTHNVWEARVIIDAARNARVATQMGTQIHAGDNFRRVVELVQASAIGPVREAHVWVGRAWGWQSEEEAKAHGDIVSARERPSGSSPVPQGLDWDLWIGPAPFRPFHEVYWPGPKWYRWWDFGNGTMSDLGSHWNDLAWWALKLDHPLTIEAEGPPPHAEIAPASMHAVYTYGARGDLPPVTLHWYQGTMKPKPYVDARIPQWGSGVLFVGSKGMLLSDYDKHVLLPEAQYKDYQRPPQSIPKSKGHYEEWLHACKTGEPTTCDFLYSGPLTIANHLGNVAFRAAAKLEWDPANLKARNCPAADRFIRRDYRLGWTLA
ncbi:MAG TPA: Gfo/Idh/MocA family oxidoreductase [Verrucomicrobiota bacterium]|nr:Gfo/Idh/MocA family oxidoreductase [Verrucomicrobiota bacterium]HNU49456.1 Gfo/Idh/MocA family oxidoreductase [Verrucomicrobiota bacterium]